jgi:hypothetical protein
MLRRFLNSTDYIASNGGIILNDKWWRILKKAELLQQLGQTAVNHEICQNNRSPNQVSNQSDRIWRSANHYTTIRSQNLPESYGELKILSKSLPEIYLESSSLHQLFYWLSRHVAKIYEYIDDKWLLEELWA